MARRASARSAVLATCAALFVGCDFDIMDGWGDDECQTDADCPGRERCNTEAWFGNACELPCESHADCPRAQYCDHPDGWGASFPACRTGCRNDAQCEDGLMCWDGRCETGCRDDAECSKGQICTSGRGISLGSGSPPQCVSGCREDSECAGTDICWSQTCVAGCRDDDECEAGSVCDDATLFQSPQCRPGCRGDADCVDGGLCVKASAAPNAFGECQAVQHVQCGLAACPSALWIDPNAEAYGLPAERALAPCCPMWAPDTCGYDLSPIYVWLWGAGDTCLAAEQPGVPDPECPSVVAGEEHPDVLDFEGCRRSDGTCGFASPTLAAAGIACVEATFVLCADGSPCEPACEQRCVGTCVEVVPNPVDGVQADPVHVCEAR